MVKKVPDEESEDFVESGERSRMRVRTETPPGDTAPAIPPEQARSAVDDADFASLLVDDMIDGETAVNAEPGEQDISYLRGVEETETETQPQNSLDNWEPPTLVTSDGNPVLISDANHEDGRRATAIINPNASLEKRKRIGSSPPPPRLKLKSLGRYGRYEILGQLAVGGMAEIYLARETSADGNVTRLVVIKRIREQSGDDDEFVSMFINEARVAMYLRHPNICYLYEYGRVGKDHFLAIEYIDGQTYRKLLGRASSKSSLVPHNITVKIVSHIAGALHHAHRATDHNNQPLRIVHRDISPHNIMLGYDGVVKLLDFGVAKAATQTTFTKVGIVRGKFAYMSPQQCMGEPLDGRSDLFSLGTVLFEGLTGRRLFRRDSQFDTMHAIVEEPIPAIQSIDASVPDRLARIVDRALQKDPNERFQTGAEFQQALEGYLATTGEVVSEGTISTYMRAMFAEEVKVGPALSDDFELAGELKHERRHFKMAKWLIAAALLAVVSVAAYLGKDHLSALTLTSSRATAGSLAVYASPGAEVFVDDVSYGDGEVTVENLRPGKHTLRVVKDGYRTWVGEVDIRAKQMSTVQPPLVQEAPRTTLRVAAPDGAWVTINNHRVSEGGEVSRELKPGRYRIAVGKEGYRTWSTERTLEQESTIDVVPKLETANDDDYGLLSINASVPGTEVWLHGRSIGKVPIRSFKTFSGKVYLELRTPDGKRQERQVDVPDKNRHTTHFFKL